MTKILDKYRSSMLVEFDFRKGSFADQSGNGNDLTPSNVYWGKDDKGRKIVFDDAAAEMTFTEVTPGDNLTIIAFAKPKSTSASDNVIVAYNGGGLAQFDINDDDSLRLYLAGTSPASVEVPLVTSTVHNKNNVFGVTRTGGTTSFFLNGLNIGEQSQTGNSTGDFGLIGNVMASGKVWDGSFSYITILNTALTDTEMAQVYEELKQSAHYDRIDIQNTRLPESITARDDYMLATSTGKDVSGNGNDGTLHENPIITQGIKGNALFYNNNNSRIQIPYDSSLYSEDFTICFWLNNTTSTGGTSKYLVGMYDYASNNRVWVIGMLFTDDTFFIQTSNNGTNADYTSFGREVGYGWQHVAISYQRSDKESKLYVNGELINTITADYQFNDQNSFMTIGGLDGTNATDVSVDDVRYMSGILSQGEIQKIKDEVKGKVNYKTDGKGWNESVATEGAGFLSNTGWSINFGTWKINTNKQIECVTNGIISRPSTQAYGTWEFDIYKSAEGSSSKIGLMSNNIGNYGDAGMEGYWFVFTATEKFRIVRADGGGNVEFDTADDFGNLNTWYRIKITRDSSGEFTLYYSTDEGDTYNLITAGGGHSNPFTENTVTSSSYFSLDNDSTDKIKNFTVKPYID